MAFRPETARPLNDLVEILLHGPNSLTPGERELIATYVSSQNDCYYCQTIHGAIAAACLNGDESLVKQVKSRLPQRRYLGQVEDPADHRRQSAKGWQDTSPPRTSPSARTAGATDIEIHDTVLIAAAFCMFNRYVDGLGTTQPRDEAMYRERGKWIAREGYVNVSKEYLPAETAR